MSDVATDLARTRGAYGVDGDFSLIPAPVLLSGYLLLCLAATIVAGLSVWRFSRRGKLEVWAQLLTG